MGRDLRNPAIVSMPPSLAVAIIARTSARPCARMALVPEQPTAVSASACAKNERRMMASHPSLGFCCGAHNQHLPRLPTLVPVRHLGNGTGHKQELPHQPATNAD